MSEIEKIIYTSLATIGGGTILFFIGQLISKRSIDPCVELRTSISKVKFTLSYFAPIINTPVSRTPERSDEAAHALRERSAELFALVELVPKNRILRLLSFSSLPTDKDICAAAVKLRGLSTYMHETDPKATESLDAIQARIRKIETLLGFQSEENT